MKYFDKSIVLVVSILTILLCIQCVLAESYTTIDDTSSGFDITLNNDTEISQINYQGRLIQLIPIGPGLPPDNWTRENSIYQSEMVTSHMSESVGKEIGDVPILLWSYGCFPTAAAMLFGYYDRNGYPNIYTGPTNGGVFPLDNSVWGSSPEDRGECPLSASHKGIDGRTINGNVDDYYYSDGSWVDPFWLNWPIHTNDCIADYMTTSRFIAWSNPDGGSFWANDPLGAPVYDFPDTLKRDSAHGMRLFAESKGYTVATNYNQLIYGYRGNGIGFTYDQYKAEIDAGYPVIIILEGHAMLGVGYTGDGSTIIVHDTYSSDLENTMTWGGVYAGHQHMGVTVFHLAPSGIQGNSLSISSIPTGAKVYLDGIDRELRTNTEIINLAPGAHTLRLYKVNPDYITETHSVTITAGQTTTVSYTLAPVPTTGSISVSSTPTGAGVWLDGVDQQTSTNTILANKAPGTHTLRLTKSGYNDEIHSVIVTTGQTTTVSYPLTPQTSGTGSISVSSTPIGAEVWLDGIDQQTSTNTVLLNKALGTHTLRLIKTGYNDEIHSVTVTAGQTTPVSYTLTPLTSTTGSMSVSSTPTGAEVWLDGVDTLSRTPIPNLITNAGTHTVKLTLVGYSDYTTDVTVISGQMASVNAALIPINAPTPLTPGSQDTPGPVIDTLKPKLQWSAVPGADKYTFYVYSNSGIVYGQEGVTTTSWTIPEGYLSNGKSYNWVVQGHISSGWSALSPKFYFQTPVLPGSLSVTSIPTGAEIWLDEVDKQTSTNAVLSNIAPGTHTIRLTEAGYVDEIHPVTITSGQTTIVSYTLSPLPTTGSISVSSSPTGAEVWLDGVDQQTATNTVLSDIAPGTHTIRLMKTGYLDVIQTIAVTAGETTTTSCSMTPTPPEAGSISISSIPTGAKIWLNEVDLQASTNGIIQNLIPETYTLRLTKDGYYDEIHPVTVTSGQTTTISYALSPSSPTPTASFTATPTSGTVPLAVQFNDTSTGAPTQWNWSFGDGATSSVQNPAHTYTQSGNYTVSLNATNSYGNNSTTRPGYITVGSASLTSTLAVQPVTATVGTGSTRDYTLILDNASPGLAGYNITVALSNASVGEIVGVTYPEWATLPVNSTLPGDSVWIKAVDLSGTSGTTNITFCTIRVRGDLKGTTNITITPEKIEDRSGGRYNVTVIPGQLTVGILVKQFPNPNGGYFPLPTAPCPPYDKYYDIDGSGFIGFNDVVVAYTNIEGIEAEIYGPVSAYEFDGNGWIGFNDVIRLYQAIDNCPA